MSENYIVSARKYRPQTFDTVVGQEHITTTLKNAIRHQHLAHAYLFCGPRGVGKTTCARILARTINCEHPTPDMEACGVCTTCQSFKDNTSFNVFELDAASNNSVDDIRNLIDQVRFAPQQGKYKIYIIDEVHMLSAAAFNAFLKTLEEPPPYAIFILATTEKHKILPTILSRCQIFDFKRITTGDIVAHLHSIATKEGVVAQEAALHVIAQKSEGAMRDALSMLDRIVSFTNGMLTYQATMEHLNLLDADFYFKLTDHLLSQDISNTLLLLDQTLEKGFEGNVILEGLAEHMRNLLLCKDQRMAKLLDVPNDHKPVYYEKANQAPPSFILSALNAVNDSELNYKSANNKRLHVEMCLIKLCYLLQATDVKKNLNSVGIPVPQPAATPAAPAFQPPAPAYQAPPPPAAKVIEPVAPLQQMPVQPVAQPEPGAQQAQELPKPAAAIEPEPSSIHTAPATPDVTAAPQRAPLANNAVNRRISKNLMDEIDAAVKSTQEQQQEARELTMEHITSLFEGYKNEMRAGNKSMLYAQLCMMSLEVYPPDEVRIITPTQFTDSYARDQRNILIDYFRKHTGITVLRVTTEMRENKEMEAEQQKPVLSKSEVFDAMAAKNPDLGLLKDALGLQIEY
ncbi:MAG: DNA polymerase III subunit gamma/tau [Sphingobacteriales bacterium]|nr:MAG: DNA polymerase III subunit gamma/tau [Sphingobacteriales bacterium]